MRAKYTLLPALVGVMVLAITGANAEPASHAGCRRGDGWYACSWAWGDKLTEPPEFPTPPYPPPANFPMPYPPPAYAPPPYPVPLFKHPPFRLPPA